MRRVPVYVSRDGTKSHITAVLREVSPHSVFIGTLHPFPVGSKVEITPTDKDRNFLLRGLVTHRSAPAMHLRDVQAPGMEVEVSLTSEQERQLQLNRRPMKRADLSAPAVGWVGSERYRLRFCNISASGAALTCKSDLSESALVRLMFNLPDTIHALGVNGIVVRKEQRDDGSLIAIEFVEVPDQAVVAIDWFVYRKKE